MNNLKPFQERTFVPQEADLKQVDQVVALYQQILDRSIGSTQEFEAWLLDESELDAALSQVGSQLYIAMSCQTDDEEKSQAYQDFVQTVEPAIKPIGDAINKKFLELKDRFPLDEKRYQVFIQSAKTSVEMFVGENIPLQTELSTLSQEYQTLCGAMMVDFEGAERTIPEMGKFLLEPNRELRERAWRATTQRRLQDQETLDEIFQKMLGLRQRIASNAGFENYRDYQFKAYERYDYTPSDCKTYHKTIKECVVPLLREIDEHRKKQMQVDALKPWDGAVDPLNRAPLKPFEGVEKLKEGTGAIIAQLDSELAGLYQEMRGLGLLDLESRKGKAPGGYQSTLNEARKPFIFMNAVGVDGDVRTLLHESGHAFHSYLCAHDPLVEYRHGPMEFCEVASMSMELMGNDYLSVFYSEEDQKRSTIEHLEGVISVLAWVATIDAFQHWIYENPAHSKEERRLAWLKFHQEFGAGVSDWSGLENERSFLWHRQLHIFEVPFYYIEYGIAQLGALQIWKKFREGPKLALADYKKGLALGGSRPLPELFSAAGIKFDFSRNMIQPLMDEVFAEWKKLVG